MYGKKKNGRTHHARHHDSIDTCTARLTRTINTTEYRSVSFMRTFALSGTIVAQVIVGEHEELPEAELNDASMAVDPEVEDLLENGNMEQLATLVLNGEGRRLVGRQSSNPELQAFIDNVPAYIVRNKSSITSNCVSTKKYWHYCVYLLFFIQGQN